jgi:hypothetical protein
MQLAIGGGTWYGEGGLAIMNEDATRIEVPAEGACTISNVAWTSDHVLASAWGRMQRDGRAQLYTSKLAFVRELVSPSNDGPATGLVIDGDRFVVRHHRDEAPRMFAQYPLPPELRGGDRKALTNQRIVVAGDRYVTGDHGRRSNQKAQVSRFVIADRTTMATQVVEVPRLDVITAITALPDGTIYAGGIGGAIVRTVWRDLEWHHQVLRDKTEAPIGPGHRHVNWSTYAPDSIVAMCTLPDGRVVHATASGYVSILDGESFQIPIAGTIRALAAHPDGHAIAVGVKVGNAAAADVGMPSQVYVLRVAPNIAAYRSERTRALANDPDPTARGVLADLLEELGAPVAVHGELRAGRGRWIIDALHDRPTPWVHAI